MCIVELSNGETLRVTPEHRFYTDGKWIPIEEFEIGDLLQTKEDVYLVIENKTIITTLVEVFNLEVEDNENYYVTVDGILVHNGYGDKFYKGKLGKKSSEMQAIKPGTKEWDDAVKEAKKALEEGSKFQVKTDTSTNAKKFLEEVHGKMDRRKAHTQSKRLDGVPKYKKGYEQHQAPEGGLGDEQHIKWYNNGTDGHIFYKTPN